jgi:hypothetical protein
MLDARRVPTRADRCFPFAEDAVSLSSPSRKAPYPGLDQATAAAQGPLSGVRLKAQPDPSLTLGTSAAGGGNTDCLRTRFELAPFFDFRWAGFAFNDQAMRG